MMILVALITSSVILRVAESPGTPTDVDLVESLRKSIERQVRETVLLDPEAGVCAAGSSCLQDRFLVHESVVVVRIFEAIRGRWVLAERFDRNGFMQSVETKAHDELAAEMESMVRSLFPVKESLVSPVVPLMPQTAPEPDRGVLPWFAACAGVATALVGLAFAIQVSQERAVLESFIGPPEPLAEVRSERNTKAWLAAGSLAVSVASLSFAVWSL